VLLLLCAISLYSVVKQQLKCNTGKVFNCLIQILLTTVVSRKLSELKTAVTVYIRNISQADLQKVFAKKIKRVQACIDAHGHHFHHLL
jgi:hypothetical protein